MNETGLPWISDLSAEGSALNHALCDEDRLRIDRLTASIDRLASAIVNITPPSADSSGRSTGAETPSELQGDSGSRSIA